MSSLQFKTEDHSTTFEEAKVWAHDCLQREDAAQRLSRIVSGQERPLTICLNGEWGSGKTFFLTRFKSEYCKGETKGRAVYFNAWQDDFMEDPLLAIICQLKSVVKDKTATALYNAVKKAALPYLANVGLGVGKQLAKQFLKIDLGMLTAEDLKSDEELVFSQYHAMDVSRRVLRERLKAFAAETKEKTGKPLLFVIDELDRCRPTFAIEVLERIKHLFCVPNLVFVIGVDVEQLGKSIQAVYGDIDSSEYLHRFFDIEIKLPQGDRFAFVRTIWEELRLEAILMNHGVNRDSQACTVEHFLQLIKYRNVKLRQIEKCVRTYAFLATSNKNMSCQWALLAAIAVVLKVTDDGAYRKFVNMEYGLGDLLNDLYPGASYREINGDGEVYSMAQHLSKIAYYWNVRSSDHLRLEGVKKKMESHMEVEYDPKIMPKCFGLCSSDDMKNFYSYVFSDGMLRETREFPSVPNMLKQMDEGLRFVGM